MSLTHLLITRPEPECTELARSLERLPLQVTAFPAYDFEALPLSLADMGPWLTDPDRLAVFTSLRAVKFTLPQLPPGYLQGATIASLGPATSAALQADGFTVDIEPADPPSTETLLAQAALANGGGRAMIFAAPGGRERLYQGLETMGWEVRNMMAYRRQALPIPQSSLNQLEQPGKILSVWTSGNAMTSVLDNLSAGIVARVLAGSMIVASSRLARRAGELGAADVSVAAGPDNQALAGAVTAICEQQSDDALG